MMAGLGFELERGGGVGNDYLFEGYGSEPLAPRKGGGMGVIRASVCESG